MTREHAPRPGRTWETAVRSVEHVVEENQAEPRPNRETRRAAARTNNARQLFTAADEYPLPPDRTTTDLPDIGTYPPGSTT
ncbi:hypothetical protein ACFYS8_13345 [Kitasatospora sp. NPDC004615]|uniref:hypothetical protein n=1 Tax=unclassified Kitasatospora TaxID=2633591 RepID=UPI0036773C3A